MTGRMHSRKTGWKEPDAEGQNERARWKMALAQRSEELAAASAAFAKNGRRP